MILSGDLIRETLHEVKPLVEEEMNLKYKGEYLKVDYLPEQKNKSFLGNCKNSLQTGGWKYPTIYLKANFPFNQDFLKQTIAHEYVHALQDTNFPMLLCYQQKCLLDEEIGRFNAIDTLIEGDATQIEKNIAKKLNLKKRVDKKLNAPKLLLKKAYITLFSDVYDPYVNGEKILREKFNGDRKKINELYEAPTEELVKIFGAKS